MGIVDPWPEPDLDEKFVLATINSFHKAFDCMNSRLEITCSLNRKENILDYSRRIVVNISSTRGCYGKQNGQNEQSSTGTKKINFQERPIS